MVWNSDTVYALGLHRMIGKIIGIWPTDQASTFSKVKFAFFTITLMWMCTDYIKQLSVNGSCGTITEMVDVISFLTCGFLSMMKIINIRAHGKYILEIVNSAVEDWSKLNERTSRIIMLQYANTGRKVFISLAAGFGCSTTFLVLNRLPPVTSLWDSQSNFTVAINGLPTWSECWIPVGISMNQYIFQFIFQTFMLAVLDTCYSSCDSFFFGLAMHLCGQLEVLSTSFENLYGVDKSGQQTYQLVQFVKRHQYLLMLLDMLEAAYNFIILVHVGVSTMIICISGIVLLISLDSSDFTIVGDMFLRIVLTYLQIFLYCYAGDQLNSQTTKLRNTIYNNPWYDMPPNSMRNMLFVIMRCHHPFNLTAGKIYTMNSQSFLSIIKTITSYFSVIRLLLKDTH